MSEPISAEEARAILQNAIIERLGEDWDDEHIGWTQVSGHDYMARLTNGRQTIDFYVDLVGEVTVQERDDIPNTDTGRVTAWIVLGTSLFIAFMIARFGGFI
jgi:hypothetical protein